MSTSNQNSAELLNLPVYTTMKDSLTQISPTDPVSTALDLMMRDDVGAIAIVENDRPVGIVTEKDLLERVFRLGKDPDLTPVSDIMSKPAVTIEAERSIGYALSIMKDNMIKRLIVTRDGLPVGLTTERRLLEMAYAQYVREGYGSVKGVLYDYASRIGIVYVSTYPPRVCGIATYTEDLVGAISRLRILKSPLVAAINDKSGHYDYGAEVRFQIESEEIDSYVRVADKINQNPDINIVNIQHEYGIFGGTWGEHIITFLDRLQKPIVTTLHTVLEEPSPDARRILEEILKRSNFVIVMATVGIHILEGAYQNYVDRLQYVPHGCPNVPYVSSEMLKGELSLENRTVLSTFGLLSQGKGIEYSIQALPKIVEEYPQALYLIIGQTHPEVRKHEGEIYRRQLLSLVEELGLSDNVKFVDRFLARNELVRYLQATDIYIIPYTNREQVSSGTLLYALSTGKAIVSTPFLHAQDVIREGCALECEFKNSTSIAECTMKLLKDAELRKKFEKNAYQYSRSMIWPNVAMKYINLFHHALGFG